MSGKMEHTGKSPEYDRAIEKLRAGMGVWDVFVATGIPVPTLKTWARKAGIALPKVTAEDRQSETLRCPVCRQDNTDQARERYQQGRAA